MDFAVILNYFPYLLKGGLVTLQVSALTLVFGSVLGLAIAFMRISSIGFLR